MAREQKYKYHPARRNQILEQVSILDVASDFYTLTNTKGSTIIDPLQFNTNDRFSTQEHDSLILYKDTNTFYRFATGEGGDVFAFLQKMPEIKMSFMEAFDYLYEKVDPSIQAHSNRDDIQKAATRINVKNPYESMTQLELTPHYARAYDVISEYADKLNRPDFLDKLEQYKKISAESVMALQEVITYAEIVEETYRLSKVLKDSTILEPLEQNKEISIDSIRALQNHLEEPKRKEYFQTLEFDPESRNALAYLIQTRKIDKDIVFDLLNQGLIRQASKLDGSKFCVFLSKNVNGEIENLFKRACNYKAEKSHISKLEDKMNKGNGWLLDKNAQGRYLGASEHCKTKTLVCFEGYIDMLSYMTKDKQQGVLDQKAYLSIGGVYKRDIVLQVMEQYGYKDLVIAFDNDEKGQQAAEKLQSECQAKDMKVQIQKSQGKDWNEDLCKNTVKINTLSKRKEKLQEVQKERTQTKQRKNTELER